MGAHKGISKKLMVKNEKYFWACLVCLFCACSHRDNDFKQQMFTPEFQRMEAAFPQQFSVNISSVISVEFCPDNTGYSFEALKGIEPLKLADFIYLYVFYSSQYASVKSWRNSIPAHNGALKILNTPKYVVCKNITSEKEKAQCVMDFIIMSERVKVFRINYDEGERTSNQVNKVSVGVD